MERLLLTLVLVALILLSAYGILVGWRHRAARQSDLAAPPAAPADLGDELCAPLSGLYVSTTNAGSWQDRIVAHTLGRRAAATVHLSRRGVLIDRVGETAIFIPAADLVAVGAAPGIAGKVMAMPDGVLVITWDLGGVQVDSGLRLDDLQAQAEWIQTARQLIPGVIPGATTNDGATA
ncbi:hypothetical protein SAMN04515671_0405 [Nakamurella panacisegetis]|uniref:PH domain-containing protein n=1 Tax=Nakamurella panacisegetis TaxID=1090615 RepID=A0A1H0I828_9ACTN|nr:hypothetical protein [Nakamurella panacisegetis]SDO27614.1 hypothetical protein SAMN04515671_0405 [Nakamurella panacisegetis]